MTSLLGLSGCTSRAYFKESLQLQRTEKFQTSNFFIISCEKSSHFLKVFEDPFLVISTKISTKNSDDLLFYSRFLHFLRFSPSNRCRYTTAQPNFFHRSFSKFHSFHHSFLRFSTVPVQNLQLQQHNSHFTTANYILQLHKLSSVAR